VLLELAGKMVLVELTGRVELVKLTDTRTFVELTAPAGRIWGKGRGGTLIVDVFRPGIVTV